MIPVRRRAFTMMEILVATAIASVIFSAAMSLFFFSNRSRGVTATARSLQTAMLIEEQLTDDLHRLVPGKGGLFGFDADHGTYLSFYAYDNAEPAADPIPVRAVRYFLDRPAGDTKPAPLRREWNIATPMLGTAPLESIELRPFRSPTGTLVRVTMRVGRSPDDPPGPPLVHSFLVRVNSTLSTRELAAKLLSDFKDRDRDAPADQVIPGL